MDVEFDSELSDTDYEEIDNSDTIRPYMYEPIRRERDEDFVKRLMINNIFPSCPTSTNGASLNSSQHTPDILQP